MIMTGAEFLVLQEYLVQIFWPFIEAQLIIAVVLAVLAGIFIVFLVVARELLTRAV